MPDCVALLHANDLPAVRQIAAALDQPLLLVFDPTLVDRVAAESIGPVRCMRWDEGPDHRQRCEAAHREAHALEAQLDAIVQAHLPDASIRGWQHLSLFYLHMAMQWYRTLFVARSGDIAQALAGGTCHVPMRDAAQHFYLPSFVAPLALMQVLMARGLPFKGYHQPAPNPGHDRVPQLLPGSLPAAGPYLLAHLPTCFYDGAHFGSQLRAGGQTLVQLQAKYWDVPLGADTVVVTGAADAVGEQLGEPLLRRIAETVEALADPLDTWLSRWIAAPPLRLRQGRQLLQVYRAQLITEQLIERHAGTNPPTQVVLSDHDADFHGPLLAFARRHQRPVLVLPHSKTSPDLDQCSPMTTVLHHAMQGEGVHDADGRRLPQFAIDMGEALRFDSRPDASLRTVGLLLNGTALNGVPSVHFGDYYSGIRRIAQWARERGLTLRVRSRPGQTLLSALAAEGGLEMTTLLEGLQGTMVGFAEQCDLGLMYDAPTSGALEFLARGVPLFNPVVTALTQREAATVDALLVPRAGVDETLRLLGHLHVDRDAYQRCRRQQFAAFAQRLGETRSLRSFV